jgi:hypothetical protein
MAQGYVKSLNLLESDSASDAGILENIGGAGIVADMQLLSGNLSRVSTVPASAYTTSGNKITMTGDGYVAFANRNVVTHAGTKYTVTASDGELEFELRDSLGNAFVPTGTLTRSDAISNPNLENMDVERLIAVRDSSSGVQGGGDIDEETGIYNLRSISSNIDLIEEGLGIYAYKKSRIPLTYKDSDFRKRLTFNGNIRITNDSLVNVGDAGAPGLFIQGPSGAAVRAFSDVSNPWSKEGTGNGGTTSRIETTASKSSVYELVLNEPNFTVPGSLLQSESGNASDDYTHKMKVSVKSGSDSDTNSSYETFFILLKA